VKIAYVTARFPCGTAEPFFGPEVGALAEAGLDVVLVPLRKEQGCAEGRWSLWRTSLLSRAVLLAFAATLVRRPGSVAGAVRRDVRTSPRNALRNLAIVPKACWLAAQVRKAGVAHIHAQWGAVTATMAMEASRMTGVPWSLTLHRYDILEDNLLATKVQDAAFVRCISESARDDCRAVVGSLPASVFVSHLGVAVPEEAAPVPANPPVIVCPAQLSSRKGQDILLEALARITDVPWELWLAGTGETRGQLESLASELGIAERVHLLGFVPPASLLQHYASGRVALVALATHHEGIPVSLMEAMAAGIPVVSTHVGGIPELLVDGAGLMVPPGDPAALAEALRTLLEAPGLREQLARAGRQRVIEQFEVGRTARALVEAMTPS
jgi:colanic acid/amylovoran biosynthesis glycosyltransferase